MANALYAWLGNLSIQGIEARAAAHHERRVVLCYPQEQRTVLSMFERRFFREALEPSSDAAAIARAAG